MKENWIIKQGGQGLPSKTVSLTFSVAQLHLQINRSNDLKPKFS